jgi:hypothetical protein
MGNGIMRFYHLEQYGRRVLSYRDIAYNTEKEFKEVCTRIVEKANKAAERADMATGAFNVIVCDMQGRELDSFTSGTDYVY